MNLESVKALAPAKVNISLDIIRKREDGYHDISTVIQTVSLFDTVTVSKTDDSEISVYCNNPKIPCDKTNIVYKCAERFFDAVKTESTGVHIDIDKVIPSQAGLAGGSSDGAATLVCLNKLFDARLSAAELKAISEKVGSDLPFLFEGSTQHATKTGTMLKKLLPLPKCFFVICKPEVNVSTQKAYELFDSKAPKDFLYSDEVIKMLYRYDIRGISSCMFNEFETLMQIPQVSEIKKVMKKNKALGASMSGSGSAVFGIFLSEKKAQKCCELLKQTYDEVFVCKPIKHGCKII